MREIYLIRHGETEWAREGKHTGLSDIPLTDQGESQAAQLAKRIETIPFDHIFSSPLKRALDTCTICGFDPQIDKDLVEWDYGAYEGLTSTQIHETHPQWNLFTHGSPNGESIETATKRAQRFIKKMEKLEGKIAVFSSGHILRMLLTQWLALPVEAAGRFPLATASLSILGYEHEKNALQLWNDVSHIHKRSLHGSKHKI